MQPTYEQPKNTPPNPVTPAAPTPPAMPQPAPTQPPSNKKRWIIICIVVVVVALAGFGLWYFFARSQQAPAVTTTAPSNTSQKSSSDNTTKPPTAPKKDELTILPLIATNPKNEVVKGSVGQQIEMSDGFCFKILNIEHGWLPPKDKQDEFNLPAPGHELMKVTLAAGSRDDTHDGQISSANFYLMNDKGALQSPSFGEEDFLTDALPGQALKPGEQLTGSMVFELGVGQPVTFVYETKYNTESGKTITLRAEIPL